MENRTAMTKVMTIGTLLVASLGTELTVSAFQAQALSGILGQSEDASTNPRQPRKKPDSAAPQESAALQGDGTPGGSPRCRVTRISVEDDIRGLKAQIAHQQEQIEQLLAALEQQKRLVEKAIRIAQAREDVPQATAGVNQSAKASAVHGAVPGVAPVAYRLDAAKSPARPISRVEPLAGGELAVRMQDPGRKTDEASMNLGGFKFSGDFRFRGDAQLRSGNSVAGPLQNLRSRYRLRLNIDKELDPRFKFHMQLSTGPLNNGITNDQDFAGMVAKHPFSVAEAYVDYHPGSKFSIRGGRMEEVFADNMRFLWDDDVRFNGFQQIVTLPLKSGPLGMKTLELRSGEYILSNPNVVVLSATSPFTSAGFLAGTKIRDSNLFHPGFVVKGDLGTNWSHQLTGDVQVYRNPNEIQLASTANGFPVLVSNALGIALSGPTTGAGNATTTAGGAIFSAPNFQIVRAAYRVEHKVWTFRGREMPAYLDFQASRNTGTSRHRDAVMASANLGAVKGFGDVRFLYQFAYKEGNALISQFTDDDLGTGSGVNIKVHAVRFDIGLTRFLQWQNLLFIQDELSPSNPAQQFFVPLQKGANTTYRYLGQLAFTF